MGKDEKCYINHIDGFLSHLIPQLIQSSNLKIMKMFYNISSAIFRENEKVLSLSRFCCLCCCYGKASTFLNVPAITKDIYFKLI